MQYPYEAWVLTPQFMAKLVTITKEAWGNGAYLESQSGKIYHNTETYSSKEIALEFAQKKIDEQQAALDKKQANLNKRIANLQKQLEQMK